MGHTMKYKSKNVSKIRNQKFFLFRRIFIHNQVEGN